MTVPFRLILLAILVLIWYYITNKVICRQGRTSHIRGVTNSVVILTQLLYIVYSGSFCYNISSLFVYVNPIFSIFQVICTLYIILQIHFYEFSLYLFSKLFEILFKLLSGSLFLHSKKQTPSYRKSVCHSYFSNCKY